MGETGKSTLLSWKGRLCFSNAETKGLWLTRHMRRSECINMVEGLPSHEKNLKVC